MIEKNRYGYYSFINKPSEAELKTYYSEKYYQEAIGAYEKTYSESEKKYFEHKIAERYWVIKENLGENHQSGSRLLDVGCGEGWVLKYFSERGWDVTGLDYSAYGCEKFNKAVLGNLRIGDIYTSLEDLARLGMRFDVVWLDNVLEHVLEPEKLVHDLKELCTPNAVLMIEVPNDFSQLHEFLVEERLIDRKFWVAFPDHLSYFNRDGLRNLLEAFGWTMFDSLADYPIDWNLLNSNTNYVMDPSKGKSCHLERVAFEIMVHRLPLEKVVNFYRSLADLGLGRQITGFFRLTTNELSNS